MVENKTAPSLQANKWCDLGMVAIAAARTMKPQDYVRSIFGSPRHWLPPHRRFSEYNILNPWELASMLRFLTDISVPAYAMNAPDVARSVFPSVVYRSFWRPTRFFRQPGEYGGVSSFPDEHWFFINGITTNADVARINAGYLAHLFHRPVTVVQNATGSWFVDLFECAIGKGFKINPSPDDPETMTEPAWQASAAILAALNAKHTKRVVVIAHSQGTIIVANVLRAVTKALQSSLAEDDNAKWHPFTEELFGEAEGEIQKVMRDNLAHSLWEFTKDGKKKAFKRLRKLEIYTFANCADKMRHVLPADELPYMEHFANERDLVACLGVLSPLRDDPRALIEIDGPVFEHDRAWGHLLNEHYLRHIDEYLYPRTEKTRRHDNPYALRGTGPRRPRLYDYFHGKVPNDRKGKSSEDQDAPVTKPPPHQKVSTPGPS